MGLSCAETMLSTAEHETSQPSRLAATSRRCVPVRYRSPSAARISITLAPNSSRIATGLVAQAAQDGEQHGQRDDPDGHGKERKPRAAGLRADAFPDIAEQGFVEPQLHALPCGVCPTRPDRIERLLCSVRLTRPDRIGAGKRRFLSIRFPRRGVGGSAAAARSSNAPQVSLPAVRRGNRNGGGNTKEATRCV